MRGFEEKRETLIHRTPAKSTRDCSAPLVHRTPAKSTRDYSAAPGNKNRREGSLLLMTKKD